jgi:leader peptidase (prepilin peptidase) / N-methyltransferase
MLCAYLGAKSLPGLFLLSAGQGSIFGILGILLTGRAGPEVEQKGDEKEEAPPTMTWEFLKPGLSFGRRLLLFPYCVLLQPIPDEPKDTEGNEVEWKPGATNLPFGPWLALGALELLLIGPWLADHIPYVGWVFVL